MRGPAPPVAVGYDAKKTALVSEPATLTILTPEGSRTIADLDEKHPWWNIKEEIDLDRFYREWHAYVDWLKEWEKQHTVSPRVFAHNDTQYGNLLRLAYPKENGPNHHRIIVVDFGT